MKFLFDQSADFRLIAYLRNLGHDVTAISRDYPHSLADENVLAIARQEKRILVVADRDFGELSFTRKRLTPASSSSGSRGKPCRPKSNTSRSPLRNTPMSLPAVSFWS